MKIVFLDRKTLGGDVNLDQFNDLRRKYVEGYYEIKILCKIVI